MTTTLPFPQPLGGLASDAEYAYSRCCSGATPRPTTGTRSFKDDDLLTDSAVPWYSLSWTAGGQPVTAGVSGRPPDTSPSLERDYALERAINGLRDDDPLQSASTAVMGWQRPVLWALLLVVIGLRDLAADGDRCRLSSASAPSDMS